MAQSCRSLAGEWTPTCPVVKVFPRAKATPGKVRSGLQQQPADSRHLVQISAFQRVIESVTQKHRAERAQLVLMTIVDIWRQLVPDTLRHALHRLGRPLIGIEWHQLQNTAPLRTPLKNPGAGWDLTAFKGTVTGHERPSTIGLERAKVRGRWKQRTLTSPSASLRIVWKERLGSP